MKRKGFTLIELIAVIVILAIIALIAVPVVMNIISKANKSAFKDSAYAIIKAGELYYSEHLLEVNGMENDEEFTFPNNLGNLQIKGSLPSSGKMKVSKKGKVSLAISNERYCVKKSYTNIYVTIDENIEDCKLPKEPIENSNTNISSTDECIKYNESCSNGTLVNVKVNDSENHDFYVIKDTGSKLTLIMNRNLGGRVSWITKTDYITAGGTNYGSFGNNEKGPLTALKVLEERTLSWINIPTFTYILIDDKPDYFSSTIMYQPITRNNVRARMLSYTEAAALGCTTSAKSCPNYLYNNTSESNTVELPKGYWLSTAGSSRVLDSWEVNSIGELSSRIVDSSNDGGVRPVITVSKTL